MPELSPLQVAILGVLGEGPGGIEETKDLPSLARATREPVERVEAACDALVENGYVRCAENFGGDTMLWYWITDLGKRHLDAILGRGSAP